MMERPDMDRADHRDRLRRDLAARGLDARESFLGGMHALEIPLLPDDGRAAFSILITSLEAPCEISLSGFRTQDGRLVDCGDTDPLLLEAADDAVRVVHEWWRDGDDIVRRFHSGEYDLH